MNLTRSIESAENQFKQILEEFFISVYNEESLSSHGIDHHRRVWNYSKEILKLIHLKKTDSVLQLPSKLIIASYLHDTGMSVDRGIRHGKHSRDLCIRFISENNLPERDFTNVLEAIENHDKKDYSGNSYMDDLLTILSVADDLDAFGLTGVFRYSEIYLARGTDPEKIGYLIMDNAKKRYDNFVKIFGSVNKMVEKHSKRYYILDNFFNKYNEQLPSYHFGTKNPTGFCGVIEIFQWMMNNRLRLKNFFMEPEKFSDDPVIRLFFAELEIELSGK